VASLHVDTAAVGGDASVQKGLRLGITIGIASAYLGITYSVLSSSMLGLETGFWYGGIALFCGITYAALPVLSEFYRRNKIGY